MRMRSGSATRDYSEQINGISPGIYLLFRCFLALAFFVTAITFPMIPADKIPAELKEIPNEIAVNYTIENIKDFFNKD
ncbi:MAG: hypothetical protein EOM34_15500 [Clostridia bacterium]|jgi:hypothetical protein|nr:hypothetical protein [Clostridia bacterium]NCD04120.1 hypothetical protein [Clostridia bacterium]